MICNEKANIFFSNNRISSQELNLIYNLADVCVLPSSNEGWGLSITEAMMAGKMIIANVTGGMQDQMRFEDENHEWIKFTPEFGSNHRGKYKDHGDWAFPVFPSNHSLVGSVPTPYIFDDRAEPHDIAEQIMKVYRLKMDRPDLYKMICKHAYEWVISDESMMTARKMSENVIDAIANPSQKDINRHLKNTIK